MSRAGVPGSMRNQVLALREGDPTISIEKIAAQTGIPRKTVSHLLSTEGFTQSREDRFPAGAPAAHEQLLAALKRAHPAGGVKVVVKRAPLFRQARPLTRSVVGCSAAWTAAHGEAGYAEKREARA